MKDQLWFIAATGGGLVVSVLCSDKHSFGLAAARVAAGLFCSIFLTDILIDWMDLDPTTYRNGVAGLMSMSGYAITRFLANLHARVIVDLIKSFRGVK
ncbi:hypothetical protein [Roseibium sp.]|jgi:hypothetical protein|uniref:hypothetical protein n=1 Tax=Roseibium sp. TaxID=1936156 RepID=UPI003BAD49A3